MVCAEVSVLPPLAPETSTQDVLSGRSSDMSHAASLKLDLSELECSSRESSFASCTEGSETRDERSPDPQVYPSRWGTSWLKGPLGKAPKRRTCLPPAAEPPRSLNIWSLIKDWVGKDISRLSVPVYINEPLCELQRRTEGFENSYLLDQAAEMPAGSVERLLKVTAYAVGIYSNLRRTTKPFKDLLNSTFELVYPERGYRILGEKVAHTPATHALMCEGRRWRFLAFDETHMEFVLQYIKIKPHGVLSITFDDGDVYEWNTPHIYINNLIIGNLYLDHKGHVQVTCKATGSKTRLSVSESMLNSVSRYARQVKGSLEVDGKKVPKVKIFGRWDESLNIKYADGREETLWTFKPPAKFDERYGLTSHALHLNELTEGLREKLPATDVRLRPDMRLFEDGYSDRANREKDRLEEKQRQERQRRQAAGEGTAPARWFEQLPARGPNEMPRWRYKGGYWEAREKGQWTDIPDIYGPGGEPKGQEKAQNGTMHCYVVG